MNVANSLTGAPKLEPGAVEGDELKQLIQDKEMQGEEADEVALAAGAGDIKRGAWVFFQASIVMLWSNDASCGIVLSVVPSWGTDGAHFCIMQKAEQKDGNSNTNQVAAAGLDFGWTTSGQEPKEEDEQPAKKRRVDVEEEANNAPPTIPIE